MPKNSETYLHRVCCSDSFMGRRGIVINFITPRNGEIVKEIEEKY